MGWPSINHNVRFLLPTFFLIAFLLIPFLFLNNEVEASHPHYQHELHFHSHHLPGYHPSAEQLDYEYITICPNDENFNILTIEDLGTPNPNYPRDDVAGYAFIIAGFGGHQPLSEELRTFFRDNNIQVYSSTWAWLPIDGNERFPWTADENDWRCHLPGPDVERASFLDGKLAFLVDGPQHTAHDWDTIVSQWKNFEARLAERGLQDKKVFVIGHSFGGHAAARIGEVTNQRIDLLALIDPVGPGASRYNTVFQNVCNTVLIDISLCNGAYVWDTCTTSVLGIPGSEFDYPCITGIVDTAPRRTINTNVKSFLYGFQTEGLPPTDYNLPQANGWNKAGYGIESPFYTRVIANAKWYPGDHFSVIDQIVPVILNELKNRNQNPTIISQSEPRIELDSGNLSLLIDLEARDRNPDNLDFLILEPIPIGAEIINIGGSPGVGTATLKVPYANEAITLTVAVQDDGWPCINCTGSDAPKIDGKIAVDGAWSARTIEIHANFVQPPPIVVDDAFSLLPEITASLNVLANDRTPNPVEIITVTPASHGSVSIDGSKINFIPELGFVGTDSFDYTITDGIVERQGNALIEINSENLHALPIARSEVVPGDWSIDATFNPLENDEDPLGQGFSITSVTQGTYGFVTTVGTTITYDSHSIEDGTHCITDELFNELKNTNALWIVSQCRTRPQVTVDTFTYTITNELGSSSTATDVIVVKPPKIIFIQTFPQSAIIQMTTIENDAAITTLNDPVIIDVLANDGIRSSGEILSVTHGSNGQTSTDGSTVIYTPTTNFVGVDSFDYTSTYTQAFTDPGTGQSFPGTVPMSASVKVVVYDDGIQLAPVPIATSDSVAAIQGELIEINVLDNDLNPGDDTLTIVSLSQGFSGETSTNGNTVTYQSTIEFEGEDSFNYAITNSIGRTSNAQVTIFVNSGIDADGDGLNNIIDPEMFTPSNEFSIPIQDVSGTIVSRNENKVTVKPDNSHFENGLSIATEPTSQKNNDSLITMCGSLSNIGIAANTVLHTTCTNDGISLFVDEGSVHVEFDLNSDAPVSNILNVGDGLTFDPSTLTMTILTNPISFSWNSVVFEMASFQTITLDTNPPTFEGPDKIVEEAEGSQGAHVTFDVSALDENLITHFECSIDDGENQIPITSGSLFSLGSTNMECRAVDSFGNQGVKSFEIEVVDTTPPDVLVPEGIKFEGSVPAEGVPIFFEVSANDIVGIEEPPVCHLFDSYSNLQSQVVSGDLFTGGFTPLVCLVDDIFGNTGVASFGIMVINSDTDGDRVNADTDGDGVNDFFDGCPNDPNKISPGTKGCGNPEPPVELEIPDWIKNTAGWWSERAVGDTEFADGISYLIEQDIIVIPDLPPSTEAGEEVVPDWVRNLAGWWANNVTTDQEFANAIKFLVEQGIIKVQT